jgi:acyl dehydratase
MLAAMSTTERNGPLGLSVGQRARRTQTVTAKEVELYAQITGDRNPLHFDADFARRTRFGRLVAQGGIAAGMLNALVAMDLPGAGTVFMSQSLKYLAPTYLGDTVTAEVEVLSLKPDKPVCQLRATITNQDGTVCSKASAGPIRCARAERAAQPLASSCSFSTRLKILPDGVFGIVSTNSTSPGTL